MPFARLFEPVTLVLKLFVCFFRLINYVMLLIFTFTLFTTSRFIVFALVIKRIVSFIFILLLGFITLFVILAAFFIYLFQQAYSVLPIISILPIVLNFLLYLITPSCISQLAFIFYLLVFPIFYSKFPFIFIIILLFAFSFIQFSVSIVFTSI